MDYYEGKAERFIALVPCLQEDDRLTIDGPITKEEINIAIRTLQKNKTPGLDLLSVEFDMTFQELLVPFIEALFKEACELGKLPPSFNQAPTIYTEKHR